MASTHRILLPPQRKNALQCADVYGQLPVIPTETGATDYEEGAVRKMSTSRKISDTPAIIPPEPSEYNFGFPALTPVRKLSQQSHPSDREHERQKARRKPRVQLLKRDYASRVRESSSQSFEEVRVRDKKFSSIANGQPRTRKTSLSSANSDVSKTKTMSNNSPRKEGVNLKDKRHGDGCGSSLERNFQGVMSRKRFSHNQRESVTAEQRGNGVLATVQQSSVRQCLNQFTSLEPTYLLEPVVKFACFHGRIKTTMHELIVDVLSGTRYEPRNCAKRTQHLAERMKTAVKELGLDRYKIITVVQLGEKKHQGLKVASRSLWDSQRDSFVSTHFQNASLFCVATVFGVYLE